MTKLCQDKVNENAYMYFILRERDIITESIKRIVGVYGKEHPEEWYIMTVSDLFDSLELHHD